MARDLPGIRSLWSSLLRQNGYAATQPHRYTCHTRIARLLSDLQSESALEFQGPWYAPVQVVLRTPHLAARSSLLRKLLQPEAPAAGRLSSLGPYMESWAERMLDLDSRTFLSLESRGLVLTLEHLPDDLQRVLILALAESLGRPLNYRKAREAVCFSVSIWQEDFYLVTMRTNFYYHPTPLPQPITFRIEELPQRLAWLHAEIDAVPYRPLPGHPETHLPEVS